MRTCMDSTILHRTNRNEMNTKKARTLFVIIYMLLVVNECVVKWGSLSVCDIIRQAARTSQETLDHLICYRCSSLAFFVCVYEYA